jgi:hypothetical protein
MEKKMKSKITILLLAIILLTACSIGTNTAKMAVEDYLNEYQNLSADVLNDMEKVIENESLTDDQKNIYREILKRQYQNLKYEIISESYDENNAVVTTKISVYDLYKSQKESSEYLKEHINEFYSNGKYDNNLYLTYKLNKMKNTQDRIDYTIDFNVVLEDNLWKIKEISSNDLEKIHGIYNYENG